MKAIILAGGLGTKLREITGEETPKPMILIAGKPFLEHQIRFLKDHGIEDIIIAVHHHSNKIKSYFGTGHRWGVKITYSEEDVPLGTAGAIKNAQKYVDGSFLVLNGCSYSQINLNDLINFHKRNLNYSTISLAKTKNPINYGNVIVNENKIIDFSEKTNPSEEGLISTGIYIFEPKIFDYLEENKNISLE